MGWYSRIDKKYFSGKLPGGAEKQSVKITIPQTATQTTKTGEVVTATKTSSGTKVTSSTGETKSVNVNGKPTGVSKGGSSGGGSSGKVTAAPAEVIRDGQPVSTQKIQPGDLPVNNGKIQPGEQSTKDISYYQKAKNIYKKAETSASEKLYNITGFTQEQHEKQRAAALQTEKYFIGGISKQEKALEAAGVSPLVATTLVSPQIVGTLLGTWISGGVGTVAKSTIDKPVTAVIKPVAYAGAGYLGGLAFGGITAGAAAIGSTTATITSGTLGTAGVAGGSYFAYKTGSEILAAPTSFEVGGVVAETGLKTAAVGAGFVSGKSGAAKIGDWWRTRGRVETPIEQLVIKDVLTGKKTFVESSSYGYKGPVGKQKQIFDIKVFKQKPYAFHATEQQFWKDGFTTRPVAPRPGDLPGTYTAPSVSLQFARVGNAKSYNLKLFGSGVEKMGKPAVAQIYTKYTIKPTGTSAAFVRGAKPEIEAIIPGGVTFAKTAGTTFFKAGGRRIPVDVFKEVVGLAGTVKPVFSSTAVSSASSSLYGSASLSVFNPITLGISSLLSKPTASVPLSTISSIPPTTSSYLVPPQSRPSAPIVYTAPSTPSVPSSSGSSYPSPIIIPSPIVIPIPPYVSTPTKPTNKKQPKIPYFSTSISSPKQTTKQQAFIPQAKSKGKWINLSKKPMSREAALGRMSRTMDNTLSAQGRIKPVKGTPSNVKDDYFGIAQNKLRPYRITKGKAVKMHNQFIEKRSFRADTPGEIKGLRVAQFAKQNNWLVGTTKKKKTKKKKTKWLV